MPLALSAEEEDADDSAFSTDSLELDAASNWLEALSLNADDADDADDASLELLLAPDDVDE